MALPEISSIPEWVVTLILSLLHRLWRYFQGGALAVWKLILRFYWWGIALCTPSALCQRRVDLTNTGHGPQIWVNTHERSPALGAFDLLVINHLSFPVTLQALRLKVILNSQAIVSFDQVNNEEIMPRITRPIRIEEHNMTDAQTAIVQEHGNISSIASITIEAEARFVIPVRSFKKSFTLSMTSHIFSSATRQTGEEGEWVFEQDAYWRVLGGRREGPFCSRCWDAGKQTIRMHHFDQGGARCPACQTIINGEDPGSSTGGLGEFV